MQRNSKPYIPFSQRAGLAPIPPQLQVGEVSSDLRRLLHYYVSLEIDREAVSAWDDTRYLKDNWARVAKDLHVLFFGHAINSFTSEVSHNMVRMAGHIERAEFGKLFDFVEFLIRHPRCSRELKREIAETFVMARAAYRVVDDCIVAIGTEEQAAAFERAISDADAKGATAARKQLVAAGVALRNSDWAGSVRESIHAVEAVAVRLAPDTDTLGAALKVLEQRGHLHGSLKAAFGSLYGYSSDEEGVRHALVFSDEAKVDEADALFMMGACASFVSYLLARSKQVA